MTINEIEPVPLCVKSDKPMQLDPVTPRLASLPEMHTHMCRSCGQTLSFAEGDDEKR